MLGTPSTSSISGLITLSAEALAANLSGRPDEHIELLEWFRDHCVARSLSWEVAASRLHKTNGNAYNRNSLFQAMTGARDATVSLENLCESISRYRDNVEIPVPEDGFIPTKMFQVIARYLEQVRKQRKFGFIVGENACGKTTAIAHVEREDHRITVTRMPEGGHQSALLQAMARRRGRGDRQTVRDLANILISDFRRDELLVIDEADECFRARSTSYGNKTLGFLRRFYDTAAPVCFVMDPAGYKKLQDVGHGDPLRRLYSRRMAPLFLPKFFREDLNLFARRYGLPPAPGDKVTAVFTPEGGREIRHTDIPLRVQDMVCSSHKDGLFVWLGLLKEASEAAKAAGKVPSWSWVLKSHALFTAMETEAVS